MKLLIGNAKNSADCRMNLTTDLKISNRYPLTLPSSENIRAIFES